MTHSNQNRRSLPKVNDPIARILFDDAAKFQPEFSDRIHDEIMNRIADTSSVEKETISTDQLRSGRRLRRRVMAGLSVAAAIVVISAWGIMHYATLNTATVANLASVTQPLNVSAAQEPERTSGSIGREVGELLSLARLFSSSRETTTRQADTKPGAQVVFSQQTGAIEIQQDALRRWIDEYFVAAK